MKIEILEYEPENNSKATPLLFVHGAFHGAWCWKPNFLPYFSSKGFSSYALSLRGHGESEGREKLDSYSLDDYMDDVLEAMQPLKEKPVLIGHSMGGALVQKILHLHPDKIKAAVLMASVPPNGMRKDSLRIIFTNFKEFIQMSFSNDRRKRLNFLANINFHKEIKEDFIGFLQPESSKAKKDLRRQIIPKSISAKVPMLVLGSRKDIVISARTALSIGKTYKTKPVIFPDISHDMMLDPNWKIVADRILAFFDESVS